MFALGDYVVVYHKKTIPYVITRITGSSYGCQLCELKRIGDSSRTNRMVNPIHLDKISKNKAAALLGLV